MLKKISLMTSRVRPRSDSILMMMSVIVMVVMMEARHRGSVRFFHHGFQRDVLRSRDPAAVVVLGRRGDGSVSFGKFHLDTAPSRFDLANLAPQLEPRDRMKSNADG